MPTAMHPWMDPHDELRLWPHEYNAVYEAFNRIFDCRGHGWANLQSVHLNLPFADDREFGQLHAAIRLLLPVLPALAASSPSSTIESLAIVRYASGRLSHTTPRSFLPSPGESSPKRSFTRSDYEQDDLPDRCTATSRPATPQGILQHEWLNARGAIARFDRQTIEIRVLDVQECPLADVAICAAIIGVLRALVSEQWSRLDDQQAIAVDPLAELLLQVIRDADRGRDRQRRIPATVRPAGRRPHHRREPCGNTCWNRLAIFSPADPPPGRSRWRSSWIEGPLSRRIVRRLGRPVTHARLQEVYGQLCDCLSRGTMFRLASPSVPGNPILLSWI